MLSQETQSQLHRYQNDLMMAEGDLVNLKQKEGALEKQVRQLHVTLERAKKEISELIATKERLKQEELNLVEDIRLLKQKMKALT